MKTSSFTFPFEFDEQVRITANGFRGTIDGFMVDRDGVHWIYVQWVAPDATIKREYFRARELEEMPEKDD